MPQKTHSRPGRPSRPPPAILRGPGETLEGSDICDEIHDALAVVLWRAFRTVTLWASAPERARARLYAPAAPLRWRQESGTAGIPRELRRPLHSLAMLVSCPGSFPAERVAQACNQVARWAEEEGAVGTALAFSQAAASVVPTSAAAALRTAVLAEKRGQEIRAESWFRRTIALARRQPDRVAQAHASLHLAGILARRGDAGRAHPLYLRALRLARRGGLRTVRADALFGLVVLAAGSGAQEMEELARLAFGTLGPEDPRVPDLIHALARFHLSRGDHVDALPLLQSLLPYDGRVTSPALLQANLAHAAAGTGDRALYECSCQQTWQSIPSSPDTRWGEVFLELARASLVLRERGDMACAEEERGKGDQLD